MDTFGLVILSTVQLTDTCLMDYILLCFLQWECLEWIQWLQWILWCLWWILIWVLWCKELSSLGQLKSLGPVLNRKMNKFNLRFQKMLKQGKIHRTDMIKKLMNFLPYTMKKPKVMVKKEKETICKTIVVWKDLF